MIEKIISTIPTKIGCISQSLVQVEAEIVNRFKQAIAAVFGASIESHATHLVQETPTSFDTASRLQSLNTLQTAEQIDQFIMNSYNQENIAEYLLTTLLLIHASVETVNKKIQAEIICLFNDTFFQKVVLANLEKNLAFQERCLSYCIAHPELDIKNLEQLVQQATTFLDHLRSASGKYIVNLFSTLTPYLSFEIEEEHPISTSVMPITNGSGNEGSLHSPKENGNQVQLTSQEVIYRIKESLIDLPQGMKFFISLSGYEKPVRFNFLSIVNNQLIFRPQIKAPKSSSRTDIPSGKSPSYGANIQHIDIYEQAGSDIRLRVGFTGYLQALVGRDTRQSTEFSVSKNLKELIRGKTNIAQKAIMLDLTGFDKAAVSSKTLINLLTSLCEQVGLSFVNAREGER